MRGINSLRNPMEMLEYRMVPLLMSVVKIGEELSISALTRGLSGDTKRTNICKIGFHLSDLLCFLLGHADTEMTEHYLHVQESIRQSAIQLFSEAFSA